LRFSSPNAIEAPTGRLLAVADLLRRMFTAMVDES
jgi:hypothetical protein